MSLSPFTIVTTHARDASFRSAADAPPSSAPRGIVGRLRPHVPAFVAAAVAMAAIVWLVTYGTGRLLDREVFGQFYDAQARSFMQGRWDVDYPDIAGEAFLRDGKAYGYFGFAPALPRIVLNVLAPSMRGRWSRLSVSLAAAVSLYFAYRALIESRGLFGRTPEIRPRERIAYAAFILTAGLGSTLIFLASRSYIFHEAMAWGGACALAGHVQALRYLRTGTWASLAAACSLCVCAFFCRPSVGGGAVMTVSCRAASPRPEPPMHGRAGGRDCWDRCVF